MEARLEEIRSECFADDVELPTLDAAARWSDDAIRAYFENGGDIAAANSIMAEMGAVSPSSTMSSASDDEVVQLLRELGLSHLRPCFTESLWVLASYERMALLAHLKARGVASVSERQKLATAIIKAKAKPACTAPSGNVADSADSASLLPVLPAPPTEAIAQTKAPPSAVPSSQSAFEQAGTLASSVVKLASPNPSSCDPALGTILTELSLCHLSLALSKHSLHELGQLSRTPLLAVLKTAGVDKLADRQKLANAIGRALRGGSQTASIPLRPVPAQPPLLQPAALPAPGADAACSRAKLASVSAGPLPDYRRLSLAQLQEAADRTLTGDWYGMLLPSSLTQMKSDAQFGPSWLTEAFHRSGAIDRDDAVVAIESFEMLELQGLDAQGGAGEKALLTVRYAKPDNGRHTRLFVKTPWDVTRFAKHRAMLSIHYGDGDGLELMAYEHLEGLLPVRIPRYYFGDISRASTFYVLITECVPYAERQPAETGYVLDWRQWEVGQILPKSGKYQDDRVIDAHLYYFALFRAMARMAAADKRGLFDRVIGAAPPEGGHGGGLGGASAVAPKDSQSRREATVRRAEQQFDVLLDFVSTRSSRLFGPHLGARSTLERIKSEFVRMAPYFTAVQRYLASKPELYALSHVNLQIDNAFFWRTDDATAADEAMLECGLLDWYNVGRSPTVSVWMGSLSGVEPEVLLRHEKELMRCYSTECEPAMRFCGLVHMPYVRACIACAMALIASACACP